MSQFFNAGDETIGSASSLAARQVAGKAIAAAKVKDMRDKSFEESCAKIGAIDSACRERCKAHRNG